MKQALLQWIRLLVLRDSVVKHWADLRVRPSHLQNIYKLFKIIASQEIHFVLSAQYIQLFGNHHSFMRLQRDESLIGDIQVSLALNFEKYSQRYFAAPPLVDSLLGTPVYRKFRWDKTLSRCFPRAALVRGMEREGVFLPMAILLRTALRKAHFKTGAVFLLEIGDEILDHSTLEAVVTRCRELA